MSDLLLRLQVNAAIREDCLTQTSVPGAGCQQLLVSCNAVPNPQHPGDRRRLQGFRGNDTTATFTDMSAFRPAVLSVLFLVANLVAAPWLRAEAGHCESVAVVAPGQGQDAPQLLLTSTTQGAVSPDHGCPRCPARSCGNMNGCSVASAAALDLIAARDRIPAAPRADMPESDLPPSSRSHCPPTPPPLVALSLA